MNLHEYMFYKGICAAEFARMCDLSRTYIAAILRGDLKPSDKTLRIIAKVTNGKVKAETIFMPTKVPEGWDDEGDKAA